MLRRQRQRRAGHTVTEGSRHRPAVMAPAQITVDQQAGTHLGGGVDERLERRVARQFAGKVVVEVAHPGAGIEQAPGGLTVLFVGHVQHRDPLAGPGLDPA
ncbi:hypothetical protein D3C79_665740 [compost metagenome]